MTGVSFPRAYVQVTGPNPAYYERDLKKNYFEMIDLNNTSIEQYMFAGDHDILKKSTPLANTPYLEALKLLARDDPFESPLGGETRQRRFEKARAQLQKGIVLKINADSCKAKLGLMYIQGLGGARDPELGERLLKEASKTSGYGLFFLGVLNASQGRPEGKVMLEEAAKKGCPRALVWKGYAFEDQGNTTEKLRAFSQAGLKKDPVGLAMVGFIHLKGYTARDGQILQSTRLAMTCFKKAAEYKNYVAMQKLALIYLTGGFGVDKDRAEVERYIALAKEKIRCEKEHQKEAAVSKVAIPAE